MNIIIAGAGKVGFYLAKSLSTFHNVIVIDKDSEKISTIEDSLDVLAIVGNVCNKEVYMECGEEEIDFFLAVTNSDETNIVASMVIDEVLTIKQKILRIYKNFYKNNNLNNIGNFKAIYPSYKVARSMNYLLEYPYANNVKKFDKMDTFLLSIRIKNKNLLNKNIEELKYSGINIVGVERGKEFIIFNDNLKLHFNDLIYIFSNKEKIDNFENLLFEDKEEFNSAIIFGANRLSIEISKVLISNKIEVKIVEKDKELCKYAQDELTSEVIIINSRWGHFLREENIGKADIFIATRDDDEFNIIKSLEAKAAGSKKVITINNEREYYNLMHSLGLTVIRGEKINTYYSILESISSDITINKKSYCGGKALALSKTLTKHSKFINNQLKVPSKIENKAKVFLVSKDEIFYDFSNRSCNIGDSLVAFCYTEDEEIVEKWLYKEI